MSDFVLYANGDDLVRVNVQIEDDTVWLTQKQLGELFGTSRENITIHIQNIFAEEELAEDSACKKILHTAADGKKYNTNHYNLDMIISLGYRVNSKVATNFRIWATKRLNEYITKGYAMDDERLKQGGGRYFKELLQRIRDIRSSERNFYQQVTDIYATSVDYKKDTAETKQFFATVQNKLHYAVHGMTAAEMIYARADADKSLMGLTNFKGDYMTVEDAEVAKNYLTEEELMTLNLIVSQYLDYAELQALRHKTMTMADWAARLDTFIENNEAQVLEGAGKKSHAQALKKARTEYEKYRTQEMAKLESDFDREVVRLAKKAEQPS